ncbi:MAG: hypothetical protein JWM64_92 [Frankiales bacterium]|nr:hypothetical protein [Frankiales bacterium]
MTGQGRGVLGGVLAVLLLAGCGSSSAADALVDRTDAVTEAANDGDAEAFREAVDALTGTVKDQRDADTLPADRAQRLLALAAALRSQAADVDADARAAAAARQAAADKAAAAEAAADRVAAEQMAAEAAAEKAAAEKAAADKAAADKAAAADAAARAAAAQQDEDDGGQDGKDKGKDKGGKG